MRALRVRNSFCSPALPSPSLCAFAFAGCSYRTLVVDEEISQNANKTLTVDGATLTLQFELRQFEL